MPTERPNRTVTWLWLAFCLMLALAVRSHNLGEQSLWWDESLSLHRAQSSLVDILSNRIDLTDGATVAQTIDNHPPLYFLVLGLTVRVLGVSDFALRLPSLAFGLLLIPLLFVVGRRLADENAGRLAALAGALSPMYLWYSQEARMYTMAPFLGLLSVYSLLRLLDHEGPPRPLKAVAWLAATAAMLLTHYLTLFILAVEAILLVIALWRLSRARRWAWLLAAVLLGSAGVALYALSVAPPASAQTGFSFVPLLTLLRDVLNSFSLGLSVNVDDVIFLDGLFLLVALGGLLPAQRARTRGGLPGALVIALYLLAPLALTYLAGYVRPIYMNSRHLIIITPAFYLAVGAGLSQMWPRRGLFLATIAVMVAATVFSWSQYFTNDIYHKDDHRAWGQYLRENVQPGDVVVVNPPHIYDLYEHYAASDVPWVGLPALNVSPDEAPAALDRLSTQYRNVWLALSYTPPWGDSERVVQSWLDSHLTMTMDRSFHSYASELRVSRFATRPPVAVTMQPIGETADVDLAGKLHYVGFDAINRQAEPGRSLGFAIYLRTGDNVVANVKASLRLYDDNGQLWAQTDQAVGTLPGADRWREGLIVRHDANLLVPLATPAGEYTVELIVYAGDTGQPFRPGGGQRLSLGSVTVEQASHPPQLSELPLTQALHGCAGPFELLGVNLPVSAVKEGDALALDAYWRLTQDVGTDYRLVLSLVDAGGALQAQQALPLTAATRRAAPLSAGDVVRGQYRIALPNAVTDGQYRLRLALQNVATGETAPVQRCGIDARLRGATLDVAHVTVNGIERSFDVPTAQHPVSANLGDLINVLGFDLVPDVAGKSLAIGQPVTVIVHLQARQTMDTNFSVFMHLIDAQDQIWGQHDAAAGGASHATSIWRAGEVVSTTLHVTLSPQTPATQVTAVLGLYDPSTAVRLPVLGQTTSSDRVLLFSASVTR